MAPASRARLEGVWSQLGAAAILMRDGQKSPQLRSFVGRFFQCSWGRELARSWQEIVWSTPLVATFNGLSNTGACQTAETSEAA